MQRQAELVPIRHGPYMVRESSRESSRENIWSKIDKHLAKFPNVFGKHLQKNS